LSLQSAAGGVALGRASYSNETVLGLALQNAAGADAGVLSRSLSIAAFGREHRLGPELRDDACHPRRAANSIFSRRRISTVVS